ncbi:MAG: 1-acyl-sn-glycerol-3-phosphate acyltransferase [Chroococcidiopsidaceae cyanobacterium CP_BM_ER_R8_30]|nr:1-acyl-sn-glycerol-3-phosphate acyltransferase [Chroococcidiopsidaceae cyanobacterium CP_BM_ER_R8_30]
MDEITQHQPNFYPPRLNPFLVRLAQFIAPCAVRWFFQFELVVSQECLPKMDSLKKQRLLLLPNHPTFQDPIVIFVLSARLKQTFYYLAAYELFMSSLGGIVQQLGVYSIRRGLVDRKSIAQTLKLLTQPGCRLVIFPEGGCSFQNDTIMPFRAGAVQIAFQSMSKTVLLGEPVPDLYVLPVSIKYRYTQDMSQVINRTLNRLEQTLNLKVVSGSSPYQRLRAIALAVLVKVEQDYELHTPEISQQPWEQRISLLRTYILENCEQQLGIAHNANELVRERTYRIGYALKTKADALETEEAMPKSDILEEVRASNFKLIERSVKRLLNFDAIYDGYVAEAPTPERFLDTLTRLEREVFDIDKPPPKGYRQARIKVGEPLNLKDFFAEYQSARTHTVDTVMLKIQQAVQNNLDLLNDV